MGREGDGGSNVDLSGVAPERRETIRRRIAALQAYEALPVRTVQAAERLCADIGISTPSFYRLWRSWRTLHDPAALGGALITRRREEAGHDVDYVRGVLAASGPEGSNESKVLEIERLAAAQGIRVRSRTALRRLVRKIREGGSRPTLSALPAGVIALDMVPIELPTTFGGLLTLPIAAAVIHPASAAVLSVTLSLDGPSPALAAAALLRWTEKADQDRGGPVVEALLAPTSPHEGWTVLRDLLGRSGIGMFGPCAARVPAGAVAADTIGRTLLGFDIRQRMAHRPPEARRPKPRSYRLGGPPQMAEAQAAMDERVAAASRPIPVLPDPAALAEGLRTMLEPAIRGG